MTEKLRGTLVSSVNHFREPTNYREQPELHVMLTYHQRSKHFPFRFAPSLGYMDWETQPDPFRRFEGVRTFSLGFEPVGPPVPCVVVIGLKHPYLNTGQTLAANLSIPLNSATPYRASGLVPRPGP
jgi:hypothetical protein